MEDWNGWPVERLIYLFLGVAFLVVWAQLTLFHWRGGFRSKTMWGPVIFTPLLTLIALVYAFNRADLAQTIFVWVFAIGVLEGLVGFVLHLKGIAAQVGGFTLRNIASGPPALLALTYAALAGFGLLVHYWPRIAGGTGA
jgi:hypothetical protein